MKIALVTLYGFFNYGNRLQNYALQEILKKQGHTVTSLAVIHNGIIKGFIKKFIYKKKKKIYFRQNIEIKRENQIKNFSDKYINTKVLYRKDKCFTKELEKEFDVFIVGSDQVWNPMFWEDNDLSSELNNYLLGFVKNKPKIAYAASFGINRLPDKWKERIRKKLLNFEYISVREDAGAEIVYDCISKKVPIVSDPVILLTINEWRMIESNKINKERKYFLTYFLGKQPESVIENIRQNAKKEEAEVIELYNPKNKEAYCSGPETFLEYIDKAILVYTDSYHATVFSILFHTPFVVYGRNHNNRIDMNSRIKTLLKKIGLENCFEKKEELLKCDFILADKRVKELRESSIEFIKQALSIKV